MSAIEQRNSSGRNERMRRTQAFILRSARAVNPVIVARGARAQSDQERSLQSGPSPAKRLACASSKISKRAGNAAAEDGRSMIASAESARAAPHQYHKYRRADQKTCAFTRNVESQERHHNGVSETRPRRKRVQGATRRGLTRSNRQKTPSTKYRLIIIVSPPSSDELECD